MTALTRGSKSWGTNAVLRWIGGHMVATKNVLKIVPTVKLINR